MLQSSVPASMSSNAVPPESLEGYECSRPSRSTTGSPAAPPGRGRRGLVGAALTLATAALGQQCVRLSVPACLAASACRTPAERVYHPVTMLPPWEALTRFAYSQRPCAVRDRHDAWGTVEELAVDRGGGTDAQDVALAAPHGHVPVERGAFDGLQVARAEAVRSLARNAEKDRQPGAGTPWATTASCGPPSGWSRLSLSASRASAVWLDEAIVAEQSAGLLDVLQHG